VPAIVVEEGILPPKPLKAIFEHFNQLLSGQVGIGRRAAGDERPVNKNRGFLANITMETAVRPRCIAQDVFQGVEGRPEVDELACLII
jgi:hypothetical protein